MYHTEYLYKELNVLSVKKLFYKASVLYIIKNNLTSDSEHDYKTRQQYNISIPLMHRKLTQSSFLYIGPKLYNKLPLDIKHSISIKVFKKKITDWLLKEQNIDI